MRKIILFIFTIACLASCSKKLTGIWMSYNDRVIDKNKAFRGNTEGVILDFNTNQISNVGSDSIVNFTFKKNTLTVKSIGVPVNTYDKDSLEFELFGNVMSVFRPLNLNYKLNTTTKQLTDFLVDHQFEPVRDSVSLKFTNQLDPLDETKSLKVLKSETFGNDFHRGFWYIKEIQNNYFLFLSIDKLDQCIYQFTSINEKEITFHTLQECHPIYGVLKLKVRLQ